MIVKSLRTFVSSSNPDPADLVPGQVHVELLAAVFEEGETVGGDAPGEVVVGEVQRPKPEPGSPPASLQPREQVVAHVQHSHLLRRYYNDDFAFPSSQSKNNSNS